MATSPDQTVYFNGYHNRSPGLGSVGAYQVAGTPYLTASNVAFVLLQWVPTSPGITISHSMLRTLL